MAKWHEFRESRKKAKEASQAETAPSPEGAEVVGWGVQEADARTAQEGASKSTFFAFPSPCFGGEPDANAREKKGLATQLALAYAVHKSFIFVRVPLTAAILPKVVKVLRGWGWEIGKRKARR